MADPSLPRPRVLVIDDDPLIGGAVKRILQGEHDVELLTNGRAAIALLTAGADFDVILCDLMMPGCSGIEIHSVLRARCPQIAARMLFMTGGAVTTEDLRFLEQLAVPPVAKPFDIPGLRALVRERAASVAKHR